MKSVETSGNEECGAINPVCNSEGGFVVLKCLEKRKVAPKKDCEEEGVNGLFPFTLHDAVMCSGYCYTGSKKNSCIK